MRRPRKTAYNIKQGTADKLFMKKCLEIKGELEGYARGELRNKRRAEVKEHLDLCDNCRREQAEFSAYFKQAAALGEVKAPADFLKRLNRRLDGRRGLFFSPTALKLAGSAVVLLLVVAVWQFPGIVAKRRAGETANRRGEVVAKRRSGETEKRRNGEAAHVVELVFAGSAAKEELKLAAAPAEISAAYDLAGAAPRVSTDAETKSVARVARKSVRASSARKKEKAAPTSALAVMEQQEQQPPRTREEVSRLVNSLGGVVLPLVEDKDERFQYIVINLPAANYDRFLAEMKKRGSFQAEPPLLAGKLGEMLEIRLRLVDN